MGDDEHHTHSLRIVTGAMRTVTGYDAHRHTT